MEEGTGGGKGDGREAERNRKVETEKREKCGFLSFPSGQPALAWARMSSPGASWQPLLSLGCLTLPVYLGVA